MANKKITSIMSKAKETISSNERVRKLLEAGKEKLDELSKSDADKKTFVSQIQMIIKMVKTHISGEYRSFSIQSILLLVFALIYFITPLDLLPDFIPGLGFTDDISIVLFILKSLESDIDEFREWETGDIAD